MPTHVFASGSRYPVEAFNLSKTDKQIAEDTKQEPLLSTWDISTPHDYLKSLRQPPEGKVKCVHKLPVVEVHSIKHEPDKAPIEVHSEKDPDSADFGHLHSGIQGCFHKSGERRAYYENIKQQLADIAQFITHFESDPK